MTELDFEELDKAVNDLMQETTTDTDSFSEDNNSMDDSQAQSVNVPEPKQGSMATTMPLAMKRRGRFMDVVAPAGSGVKKSNTEPSVSRHGVTIVAPKAADVATDITPTSDEGKLTSDDTEQRDVVDAGIAGETTSPVETDEYAANPEPANVWPEAKELSTVISNVEQPQVEDSGDEVGDAELDGNQVVGAATNPVEDLAILDGPSEPEESGAPNDSNADNGTVEIGSRVEPADKPMTPDEQLVTVVTPDTDIAQSSVEPDASVGLPESVMSSPFLPDAKVEKRPLGGSDLPTSAMGEPTTMAQAATDMPREYSNELLSLDIDTANTDNAPKPSAQTQDQPQAVTAPAQPGNGNVASPTPAPAQQASGAIFDTDNYHAPLKQPVKHKSGWLTVVWILVLLIVGAAAGAAYYYFMMQH